MCGVIQMNKCKTCRWWKKDIQLDETRNKCFKIIEDGTSDAFLDLTVYYCDEAYISLITTENFGCNLWESKDEKE